MQIHISDSESYRMLTVFGYFDIAYGWLYLWQLIYRHVIRDAIMAFAQECTCQLYPLSAC